MHGPFARRGPLARCYQQGAGQDRFHQHECPLSGREDNLGHRQQVPLQSPKGFFSQASAGVSSRRAKYPPKPEDAQIGKRLGLEKIKTIGDAYMVVAGVPETRADHVQAATEMALAMHDAHWLRRVFNRLSLSGKNPAAVLIMTAALELSGNQVTHFYSAKKNTTEMIRMLDVLIDRYRGRRKLYLSWDAASWHISKQLFARIDAHNSAVPDRGGPLIETAPLPAGAQFLNVIESVFSGMARAIIHNSDYKSMDPAKAAIDQYFGDRNAYFQQHPKRAGKKIWGSERELPAFSDANNCKDPHYR